MTDYTELKKLAEAASPGPWMQENDDLYFKYDGYTYHMMTTDSGHDVCDDEDCDDAHRENLKYIAAANPAAVLALIADNEKLKADLREVKDAKLGLSWALGEINGENGKLRKDAIRHRWLREHQFDVGSFYDVSEYNHKAWFEHIDDESIDRCISEDAEFAAENGL